MHSYINCDITANLWPVVNGTKKAANETRNTYYVVIKRENTSAKLHVQDSKPNIPILQVVERGARIRKY